MAAKTAQPTKTKPRGRPKGSKGKSTVRAKTPKFDEESLSKGHLRKLNAARISFGHKIGEKAFTDWLNQQQSSKAASISDDKSVGWLREALVSAKKTHPTFRIPNDGYLIKSGRVSKKSTDKEPQFKIEAGPKKPPTTKG